MDSNLYSSTVQAGNGSCEENSIQIGEKWVALVVKQWWSWKSNMYT